MKTLIIVVVVVIVLASLVTYSYAARPVEEPTLYVETMWGLANRLRCMRVAYDLARALEMRLVIVHKPDKGYTGAHPRDLFDVPGVEYETCIPLLTRTIQYNVPKDCTLRMPLDELRVEAARCTTLGIRACKLEIAGLDLGSPPHEFYAFMRPSDRVRDACAPIVAAMDACRGPVVGVHIRQGSVPDFKLGYFFGPWDNADQSVLPTGCCFADKGKTGKTPCPPSAPCVDKFETAMRSFPSSATFFVCSDRPGCIAHLRDVFGRDRVLTNENATTLENDAFGAFCDWYCLTRCSNLVLSGVSSFSIEVQKSSGAKATYV